MYRKFVWCYVFVLTLLDISLNTKLTAQGKSHGKIDFYYNKNIAISSRLQKYKIMIRFNAIDAPASL